VQSGGNSSSSKTDDKSRRLTTDEPLWGVEPGRKRAAPGDADAAAGRPDPPAPEPEAAGTASDPPAAPPPAPGTTRPFWRRSEFRVNLMLALAAAILLGIGFLLGATLTPDRTPAAGPTTTAVRQSPSTAASPGNAGSVATPRACAAAMERADQVISYLIAKIRDRRLSTSLQQFVEYRRACQQAAR
jgi:hypothetical protein